MPVTVKVNGVANSLVHKGSNGISIATIPDVCKTPSPGGPIPIPYPNISQSATLAKGTTTVKADGGMMIANNGSEFSLSNGDNPGVAGGVKSSTFMKESTWILYSFDVKMDGKNACRLTDKKFQNHENTVDLGGLIQSPTKLDEGILVLECRPDWNQCQKEQMKAKADAMDKLAKQRGGLQTRSPSKTNKLIRKVGQLFQRRFAENWSASTPTGKFPEALEPCKVPKFYAGCPSCQPTPADPLKAGMQADHVLELQFKGGNPAGPLRWLDASVNQSSGAQIMNVRKKHGEVKITEVRTANC